jgi:hypothetical protein
MLHNYVKNDHSGDHWAAGVNTPVLEGQEAKVLVQLQDKGEQVRLAMTPDQAEAMARELLHRAAEAREAIPLSLSHFVM